MHIWKSIGLSLLIICYGILFKEGSDGALAPVYMIIAMGTLALIFVVLTNMAGENTPKNPLPLKCIPEGVYEYLLLEKKGEYSIFRLREGTHFLKYVIAYKGNCEEIKEVYEQIKVVNTKTTKKLICITRERPEGFISEKPIIKYAEGQ